MNLDTEFIRQGLIFYLLIVVSISIHEWAHAITADRLGDLTPDSQGRVTLNPLAHLDPIGTGLIPLVNIFVLGAGSIRLIGWGKPVQINLSNFAPKRRKLCDVLITLAGPFSNVVLALLGTVAAAVCHRMHLPAEDPLWLFININVGLVVFNLIPIPPLDGSRIFRYIVGMSEETFIRIAMSSGIFILVLVNLPPFQRVMGFLYSWAIRPYEWLYGVLT